MNPKSELIFYDWGDQVDKIGGFMEKFNIYKTFAYIFAYNSTHLFPCYEYY